MTHSEREELARIVLGEIIYGFIPDVMRAAIGRRLEWFAGLVIEGVLKIQQEERPHA